MLINSKYECTIMQNKERTRLSTQIEKKSTVKYLHRYYFPAMHAGDHQFELTTAIMQLSGCSNKKIYPILNRAILNAKQRHIISLNICNLNLVNVNVSCSYPPCCMYSLGDAQIRCVTSE